MKVDGPEEWEKKAAEVKRKKVEYELRLKIEWLERFVLELKK